MQPPSWAKGAMMAIKRAPIRVVREPSLICGADESFQLIHHCWHPAKRLLDLKSGISREQCCICGANRWVAPIRPATQEDDHD